MRDLVGLLTRLFQPGAVTARNAGDDHWYTPAGMLGGMALSGVAVGPDTAPKVSAVYASGALISESMATLPALVYRLLDGGARERDASHPVYRLLHRRPNPRLTPFQFKHWQMWNVLFRGACYAEIMPDRRGQDMWLRPIHPDLIVRRELLADGTLRFWERRPDQTEQAILQEDMFWVDGLTHDGVNPVSVITYARESIGLAIAGEQYAARVFSQGGLHQGVLSHKGTLSAEAQSRLRQQFLERHAGLHNAHAPLILEEDMNFAATSMTPEDASLIAQREFQVEDIARWFRVPLHMIGHTTKQTSWGTGIEELSRGFVTYTLLPWLTRWEEAITRDLLGDDEEHFVEFLTDALLRADLKTRYESYQTATGGPWMTRNEVRRMENQNPVDGLDEVLVPLNLASQSEVDKMALPDDPPGPRPAPNRQAALAAYVHDTAARIVRKEQAAMERAGRRAGTDDALWADEVARFYAGHAAFVGETMRIPLKVAEAYADRQAAALTERGTPAEPGWDACVEYLVSAALEANE